MEGRIAFRTFDGKGRASAQVFGSHQHAGREAIFMETWVEVVSELGEGNAVGYTHHILSTLLQR